MVWLVNAAWFSDAATTIPTKTAIPKPSAHRHLPDVVTAPPVPVRVLTVYSRAAASTVWMSRSANRSCIWSNARSIFGIRRAMRSASSGERCASAA